jgi:hypothetical protein
LLGISVALQACSAGDSSAAYGEKVKFTKGEKITFPDFVLEYSGQHRQSSEKYPRGFLFYDFVASAEGGPVKFSWSSGTGDIGPVGFEVKQKRFSLELKRSDKLGPLKDDQLVVWKL